MIKVSIVLPIYNVEKYLDRCIESVVNQTYSNIEILLVDDGSPDDCPTMCEKWAVMDNRIRVIHKENRGLGMARNSGLEVATGDYICFFDSDDYIALNAIEKMVEKAKKYNADIVTFGYSNVNTKGEVISEKIPLVQKDVFYGKEITESFLADMVSSNSHSRNYNLMMSAWASIYKTAVLRETRWLFSSERVIISEDVYSLLDLYKYVDCVAVLSEALYFYCENSTSLTKTFRTDRFEKINFFYIKCGELCNRNGYSEKVLISLQYTYISYVIAALKMIAESSMINKRKAFKQIMFDSQFQDVIANISLKNEPYKRKSLLFAMKKRWITIILIMFKLNK